MSTPVAANDSSRWSTYVDPAFYEQLRRSVDELDDPAVPAPAGVRDAAIDLLHREARLLDEGRLEDWLELFVPECLYWMPMTPGGGDPAQEVTLAFDDRRRLEDRVAWLRSAYVWSQIPRSRTRRMITNAEVLATGDPDEVLVRSNFVVYDVRPGYAATFPGWTAHRLRAADGGWAIVVKQINLLDSDQAHANLSIIF
jgi:3-phenylpropionate/cinnamic acid dioxygenase small subunit